MILLAISILSNFGNFNTYFYNKHISYKYDFYTKEHIVTVSLYANEKFIGIKDVITLQDMLKKNMRKNLKEIMTNEMITSSQEQRGFLSQGIVPRIELPLKLPPVMRNIIGEGGEINVDGSQSITMSLDRTTSSLANLPSEGANNPLGGWQPQLKTDLNLKISGTVGKKIHVFVDHKSNRESEYNNKVKLWYQGNEDDIFQYIKAGNIDNVPGVRGGAEKKGLFGIHSKGKIGSVDFDAVTARIQSKTATDSFVGNTILNVDTIYDGDFEKDKYFLLGLSPGDSLIKIKVYEDTNYSIISGVYYYNPPYGTPVDSGNVMQVTDFYIDEFFTPGNKILQYIELRNSLSGGSHILAVAYSYFNHLTGKIDTVGTLQPENGKVRLKIIRMSYPSPTDSTWRLSLRNIYSFGSMGAKNVEVDIYYDKAGTEQDPTAQISGNDTMFFMRILGLDTDSISGIDANQVNTEKGIIVFPDLEPFANPNLSDPDSIIYNSADIRYDQGQGKKYYIVVKYSSPKMFYLLQAPIVDSSEVVTIEYANKIDTLKRNLDYTINYETGDLHFTTSKVVNPDAKLRIKWDMVPLLSYTSRYITQITTKSQPLPNTNLNTSISFSTSSTREERPKIGEEPNSIFISNINGNSNFNNVPFLNFLAYVLPFVDNKKSSKMSFGGNFAFSVPQINSKNKGYIDDMESSTNSFSIGLNRGLWHLSSTPVQENSDYVAAEFHWFSSNELAGDINPNLPEEDRYQKPPVLNLYFIPEDSSTASWGGISTFLNDVGWDISDKNFLEVWVQGDTGMLFIDLATHLAEDAPRRNKAGKIVGLGVFESEDKNLNGTLDSLEDTGLDGISGNDSEWTSSSRDDGNDDYPKENLGSLADTLKLNGTEGNKLLNTEDIDNNGKEETKSCYYEYKIDLSSDSLVHMKGKNGWKMYRIPLFDQAHHTNYESADSTYKPDSTHIRVARIWMKGVSHLNRIKIYKINIAGAKWIKKGILSMQNLPDTTNSKMKFSILFRDNFNDTLYAQYLPFDPGRDIYGKQKQEHSLALNVENLKKGYYAYTTQYFPTKMDFRLYRAISFYTKKAYPLQDSIEFFMRIMTDSLNYYQYSVKLGPGDSTWKNPEIYFNKFFDMKISGDTIRNEGNNTYYICGNPTLKQVQWIGAGVINRGENSANNEVWFDELALTHPNNNKGMNTNLTLSTNLGDFSTFTFSFSNNTPFYKQNINDLRNVGANSRTTYRENLKIVGDKLLFNQFSLPINYAIVRGRNVPYYYTNSDITLPDSLRPKNTAHNENTSISFGISRKGTSKFPLFVYTIDKMSFRGMKSFITTFEPNTKIDTAYNENASLSYTVPFPTVSIPLPFKQRWKVLPENVSFSSRYNFSKEVLYEKVDSIFVKKPKNPVKSLDGRFSFRYSPIRLFSLSYNAVSNRDIRKGWRNGGIENKYGENGTIRSNIGILNIINNTADYSFSYNENHTEQYRMSLGDSVGDIRGIGMRKSAAGGIGIKTSKIITFLPSLRDETKDKDAPTMSLQWILAKIGAFGSHLGDLQLNGKYERQSNYAYIKSRPNIRDRIWFYDTLPVKRFPSTNDGFVRSLSFSGDESFNLSPLSLHASYRWSKTIPKSNSNVPIKESITFPNISVSLSSLEKILHLKKIINSLSLSLNIVKDSTNSLYTLGGNRQETTVSWSYSPSSQIGLPRKINLSVNGNYRDAFAYSSADIRSTTENKHWNIGASTNYSFSAPTGIYLPFLKNRIKFSSNLNLTFSLNQSSDYKVQISIPLDTTKEEKVDVQSHTKITSFNISGNYQFSPSVTGKIGITDKHRVDLKKNNTFDTFSLSFTAIFKF